MTDNKNKFPLEFDQGKVEAIIKHYENQTEEEAVAEDESIVADNEQTMMQIPKNLIPQVRELIAKNKP